MVVAGAAVEVDGSSGVWAVACASGGQRECGDGRVDRGEQDTPDCSERIIGVRGATDISPRRQYLRGCVWGRWGTRMSYASAGCAWVVDCPSRWSRLPAANGGRVNLEVSNRRSGRRRNTLVTDVVTVDEHGRYRLRLERHLDHARSEVWRALTSVRCPPRLAQVAPRADPPRLLEYRTADTAVRWEIADDGRAGSVLVFTQVCGSRQDGVDEMGWWLTALEVLGEWLDGDTHTDFPRRARCMIERCRCAFG